MREGRSWILRSKKRIRRSWTNIVSREPGERLRRLTDVERPAEKKFLYSVWWPLFYNFDHLHPEYEVRDFKDGSRFLDFAYLRPMIKLCIEIDGFGPHLRQISRCDMYELLGLSYKPVKKLLDGLMEKRLIEPCSRGKQRIHAYRLNERAPNPFLQ